MVSVRFSLKDKSAKSKTTIRTSVSFDGQRFVFCPGVSLSPQQWDYKRGQPKQVKDNLDTKKVTDTLKELDLAIRKLYDELQVPFQKVEPEISSLMELNEFKCEQDEIVRDLFIVGCYNGLRFGNYSNISFDNIRNGTIDVIQVKTKTKISIPIHPSVEKILKKYDYKLPSSPTNQEFNRTLKELCCRIPELDITFSKMITKGRRKVTIDKKKWMMVGTHTARRSFCTNMYNKGVPILTIMAFSGHKSEKNLKKYIKSSVEDHTKIIKGYW